MEHIAPPGFSFVLLLGNVTGKRIWRIGDTAGENTYGVALGAVDAHYAAKDASQVQDIVFKTATVGMDVADSVKNWIENSSSKM